MIVGLVGCGGSSAGNDRATTIAPKGTSGASAPKALKPSDKTLTEAQLKAALITVADVPTGYKAMPPSLTQDDSRAFAPGSCGARFQALSSKHNSDAGPKAQEAKFQGPGLGTLLSESADSYKSASDIKARANQFVAVVNDCPNFTTTNAKGEKVDFTLSALSFPKLGDQTVSFGLSGKTSTLTVQLDVVFVRVGNSAAFFQQGGLATDAAALESGARAGVAKLQKATQ